MSACNKNKCLPAERETERERESGLRACGEAEESGAAAQRSVDAGRRTAADGKRETEQTRFSHSRGELEEESRYTVHGHHHGD